MKYLIGAAIALVGVIVLGVITSYSGFYNVAASEPHTRAMFWFLDNTKRHSVELRARNVNAPSQFSESQRTAGREHVREMCLPCHGAPGLEVEAGGSMRPEPPSLRAAAQQWSDSELFWIVRHGIKLSGMPGFGATHGDNDLWNVVAAVREIAQMSPQQFAASYGRSVPEIREAAIDAGAPRVRQAVQQQATEEAAKEAGEKAAAAIATQQTDEVADEPSNSNP